MDLLRMCAQLMHANTRRQFDGAATQGGCNRKGWRTRQRMDEKGIEKFGTIHQTIWGDPTRVIKRIVEVSRTMIVARGAVDISTVPDPIESITNETGHVLCGVSSDGQKRWDVYIHNEERVGVKVRASKSSRSVNARWGSVRRHHRSIEGSNAIYASRVLRGKRVQFFLARDMCVSTSWTTAWSPNERRLGGTATGGESGGTYLQDEESSDNTAQYYDWRPGRW